MNLHYFKVKRYQLQQLEFLAYWVVLLLSLSAISSQLNTGIVSKGKQDVESRPYEAGKEFSLSYIILFFRVSLLSRAFAYAIDFIIAGIRFDSFLPAWLVFHHFGVFIMHATKAFYLTPRTLKDIALFTVASQSSHNTWTKSISPTIYWGNVSIGILAIWYIHSMHSTNNIASQGFFYGGLFASLGVILLALEKFSGFKLKLLSRSPNQFHVKKTQ